MIPGPPEGGTQFLLWIYCSGGAETVAVPLATLIYCSKMHKHVSQRKGAIHKDILT